VFFKVEKKLLLHKNTLGYNVEQTVRNDLTQCNKKYLQQRQLAQASYLGLSLPCFLFT
jgi:hypothetical protein